MFSSLENSTDDFTTTKSRKKTTKKESKVNNIKEESKAQESQPTKRNTEVKPCNASLSDDQKTYNFSDFDNYSLIVSSSPLVEATGTAAPVTGTSVATESPCLNDDEAMSPEIDMVFASRGNQQIPAALTSTPHQLSLRSRTVTVPQTRSQKSRDAMNTQPLNRLDNTHMNATCDQSSPDNLVETIGSELHSLQLSHVSPVSNDSNIITDTPFKSVFMASICC